MRSCAVCVLICVWPGMLLVLRDVIHNKPFLKALVLRYKKPTIVALYFLFFFKHTPAQYQNEASTALCTFVFPVVRASPSTLFM